MKATVAIALGLCLAVPAIAADIDPGSVGEPNSVVFANDGPGCVAFNQYSAPNADIGIGFNANGAACDAVVQLSGLCPDDELVGFSSPVSGCADGFLACVVQVFSFCNNDVGGSDTANWFLWNDTGSGPSDACGTELLVIDSAPIVNCDDFPGATADEQFNTAFLFASPGLSYHVGASYDVLTCFNLPGGSGTDWSISQEDGGGFGTGVSYINLAGAQGGWQDLNTDFGLDRVNGQGYRVTPGPPAPTDCGAVTAIEPSTWGAIKASF